MCTLCVYVLFIMNFNCFLKKELYNVTLLDIKMYYLCTMYLISLYNYYYIFNQVFWTSKVSINFQMKLHLIHCTIWVIFSKIHCRYWATDSMKVPQATTEGSKWKRRVKNRNQRGLFLCFIIFWWATRSLTTKLQHCQMI